MTTGKNGIIMLVLLFSLSMGAVAAAPDICEAAVVNSKRRIELSLDTLKLLQRNMDARGFVTAFREAKGIAIFPNTTFDAIGLDGEGLVFVKNGDEWNGPTFASITGGLLEMRVGITQASFILIIRTDVGVAAFKRKNGFRLNEDYRAVAGTMDGQGIPGGNFHSYIITNQYFDGMELSRTILNVDSSINRMYWGKRTTPEEALSRKADDPRVEELINTIVAISKRFNY
jgi:lipid-binding SYLF domain-containing protein